MRNSGVSVLEQAARAEGVRVGKLCGEDYKEVSDPSADTHIQRAWLYHSDPSLRNIHLGGKRQALPKADNETSLSLGDGQHAKTQAEQVSRGMLYRTATQ